MMKAQDVLNTDNDDSLFIKENCRILDDVLYERCTFDDSLFTREDFENTATETYVLNDNCHVYRYFITEDDYDYVTNAKLIAKLDMLY
jgi:hypothetical protein